MAATLICCGALTARAAITNQAGTVSVPQTPVTPQDASSQPSAGSQEGGSVPGTVTDSSGAVVPGATVTVTDGATLTRGATTNARGDYTVTGLPAGTYIITITQLGFQDFQATGFALTANQQARLDASLQPTTGVTKVTVKGLVADELVGFDQTRGAPLYRRNDFGFTLGGPLFNPHLYNRQRDKTYFFYSEEIRRERTPQDCNQGVPSMQERAGNFSDVCPFAEPGRSGLPGQAVEFTRTAFPDCPALGGAPDNFNYLVGYPGNQAPIDPTASALLNTGIIPAPNSTTGCTSSISSCYDTVISLPTNWHEELFRIDHHITQQLQASVRYIHDSWNTINATPEWGFVQDSFPTIQNKFVGPGTSVVGHLTQVFSPTFLNDTAVSYTSDHLSLSDFNGPGVTYQRAANLAWATCSTTDSAGRSRASTLAAPTPLMAASASPLTPRSSPGSIPTPRSRFGMMPPG